MLKCKSRDNRLNVLINGSSTVVILKEMSRNSRITLTLVQWISVKIGMTK